MAARLSVLTVVVLCLSVVAAPEAYACSCVPFESDREAMANSDVTFVGVPADTDASDGLWRGSVHDDFEVASVYKGEARAVERVSTNAQSSACGERFALGKRYVVFAYEGGGELKTDGCIGNHRVGGGANLALPDSEPPLPAEQLPSLLTPSEVLLFTVAAVGLAATGLSIIRRGSHPVADV